MLNQSRKKRCAAIRHASEARDYFTALVKVRSDKVAADIRRKVTSAGLLAILAIAILTYAIVSIIAFARGVTGAFAELFEGRLWLGNLVGGVVLMAALALGIVGFLAISARVRFARLSRKYEQIHIQHRVEHGQHISDDPKTTE